MVFSNNSVTCDRSVHGFHCQFSDLRQVSTWFSWTIQWLVTGQCFVFSETSVTGDKSVRVITKLPNSEQSYKGKCVVFTDNSVTCYRSVLCFLWLVTGRCMVFTDSSASCDRSVLCFHWLFSDLRQVGAWVSLTSQWPATGQCVVFTDSSVTCGRSVHGFRWRFSDLRQVSALF